MSVDVKIGDDILYGASVVRLESATTPGTYEEFTLGGGGYPESVIADETVTLVNAPAPITLDPGASPGGIPAWKVKVNDIELEYIPEEFAHVKVVDGIQYVVFFGGDTAGLFVGDDTSGSIVAGDYTVNIVSPPTMDITENGPVDVSDVAAVYVDVQPVFDTREVTVELSSDSVLSSVYIQYYYVASYAGKNTIMTKAITINKGSSTTFAVYADPTGVSARLVVLRTGFVTMTSITGHNITVVFSDDKTMALVTLNVDNDHILVS